jgi:hypothetical protein
VIFAARSSAEYVLRSTTMEKSISSPNSGDGKRTGKALHAWRSETRGG